MPGRISSTSKPLFTSSCFFSSLVSSRNASPIRFDISSVLPHLFPRLAIFSSDGNSSTNTIIFFVEPFRHTRIDTFGPGLVAPTMCGESLEVLTALPSNFIITSFVLSSAFLQNYLFIPMSLVPHQVQLGQMIGLVLWSLPESSRQFCRDLPFQ